MLKTDNNTEGERERGGGLPVQDGGRGDALSTLLAHHARTPGGDSDGLVLVAVVGVALSLSLSLSC